MLTVRIPAWKKHPVLRLLLPFLLGICVQEYAAPPKLMTGATLTVFLLLSAVIYRMKNIQAKYRWRWIGGLCLQATVCCAGALWLLRTDVRAQSGWPGKQAPSALVVELNGAPQEGARTWKAEAKATHRWDGGRWAPASGGLLLYFYKMDAPPPFGSRLLLRKAPQPIRNSGNPGSFDFAAYSLRQGRSHQVFLKRGDYLVLEAPQKRSLPFLLFQAQQQVIALLRSHLSPEVQGLAEALLIGYRGDLDKELQQAYARTGVVHIIAISGMHLALVYVLLLLISRPLNRKGLRGFRFLLVLSGLWCFALLAGATPSVLRAACMFSLLALGNLINRRGNGLNTLMLAALVLLVVQPYWLWDAGFQLSFAAVAGIQTLYGPLYRLWTPENKLLAALWKISAVSLAAQAFTTPLCLYHFHQFPLLFLFANLVAVPLSGIVLYGLLLLCALAWWPAAAQITGTLVSGLLQALNRYIAWLDSYPFGLWEGIQLSEVQALLLLGCLCAGVYAWRCVCKGALYLAAGCLMAVLVLRAISFWQAGRQQYLLVYQVPKYSAIELALGRTTYFAGDSMVWRNRSLFQRYLAPAHSHRRSRTVAQELPTLFMAGEHRILRLQFRTDAAARNRVHPDIIVVSRGAWIDDGENLSRSTTKHIILDASLSRRQAGWWKKQCLRLGLPCHDVAEAGAALINIRTGSLGTVAAPDKTKEVFNGHG